MNIGKKKQADTVPEKPNSEAVRSANSNAYISTKILNVELIRFVQITKQFKFTLSFCCAR